jgi:cob(I)alamin adenosyltransferase
MFRVGEAEVKALEAIIDDCQKDLEPLQSFILPGGGRAAAFLHQCRTVCRRAERIVLQLSREEDIGPWPLRYLNRLSDLFFVLSRWISRHSGEAEFLWERGLRSHSRRKGKD